MSITITPIDPDRPAFGGTVIGIDIARGVSAEQAAQMVSINDFALWSAEEVGDWLESCGYGDYRPAFEANNVHGYKLLGLTFDMLPKLQVRQFDHCRGIMRELRILKGQEPEEPETLKDCMMKAKFAAAKPIAGVRRDLRFGTGQGGFLLPYTPLTPPKLKFYY